MEFEVKTVIYFDIDDMMKEWKEAQFIYLSLFSNLIDALYDFVNDYADTLDEPACSLCEGWIIDDLVTEMKKRLDKENKA